MCRSLSQNCVFFCLFYKKEASLVILSQKAIKMIYIFQHSDLNALDSAGWLSSQPSALRVDLWWYCEPKRPSEAAPSIPLGTRRDSAQEALRGNEGNQLPKLHKPCFLFMDHQTVKELCCSTRVLSGFTAAWEAEVNFIPSTWNRIRTLELWHKMSKKVFRNFFQQWLRRSAKKLDNSLL